MAEIEILAWLEIWYESLCDGDREHQYGIKIDTVDNPGWAVTIDLELSRFEGLPEREFKRDTSDTDWIVCEIQDRKFQGFGDPTKLRTILDKFREWIEAV